MNLTCIILLVSTLGTTTAYGVPQVSRKAFLATASTTVAALLLEEDPALASEFTPGGSIVDRPVGIQVGNNEASTSRATDNSNVLFGQDYYFKFGNAAQWIEPDATDFPKTMPFVLSQQRYDAKKKYSSRVMDGLQSIKALQGKFGVDDVPDASDPAYALRAMGLFANSFMASENTGLSNELLVARWYINEMYLNIGEMRSATSAADASKSYKAAIKAGNSYLSMLNRQINAKVGDKLSYL